MKIYVDEMPKNAEECLYAGKVPGSCVLRHEGFTDRLSHCKLENGECPCLKVYYEPKPVREYPSYFVDCC